MSILINIKNLNLSFGEKIIFKDAELTITKGDKIGLIGLNGQGKSTLFNILMEKTSPDISTPPCIYDKSNIGFEICLIPQELNIKDYADLSIENFYLSFYPDLYEAQKKLNLDYADEAALQKFEDLGGWEIQNSYLSYLKSFGFNELNKDISLLSGGERKKIALSIGLSSRAEMILWDEPTNHLDIESIERFEDELNTCQKTYMIISHDRYLLNHTTDSIFHISRGEIEAFKGTYLNYLEYLDEKEKELAKNLDKLQNKHRRELAWMRQGIKARRTRSKKRVEGFNDIKENIADIKSRVKRKVNLELQHSGRKSKILCEVENGSFSYDDKEIFRDISFSICKKEKIALIGKNGVGKSTLINIIREKEKLSGGKQKNAENLKLIVFDQHRESLDPSKTPMEVLKDGSDFVTLGDGRKKHINSYLQDFLFSKDQVHRPISTLSGGEKNRLQLAIFMKESADLWVFDEPTNDLDIETIELLEKELKSYEAAVIIIGHDRAFLDNVCDSTWLIHDNKLEIFEGGYTQIAPYLHALEQQDTERKGDEQEKSTKKKEVTRPKKLSFKDKKILESIMDDIEKNESLLESIMNKINNHDFSKNDEESLKKFNDLNFQKDQLEEEIKDQYETWEKLNSMNHSC